MAASLHLGVPSTHLLPFTLSPALGDALIYSMKAQDGPHAPRPLVKGEEGRQRPPCNQDSGRA